MKAQNLWLFLSKFERLALIKKKKNPCSKVRYFLLLECFLIAQKKFREFYANGHL